MGDVEVALADMLDEQPYLARWLACEGVDGVDAEFLAHSVRKQVHQIPVHQVVIDQAARHIDDAAPPQRRLAQGPRVVGAKAPRHRQQIVPLFPLEGPLRGPRALVGVAQAVVGEQVWRLARRPEAAHVGGGGADHPLGVEDVTGNQARVIQIAGANNQIEPLFHQVDEAVVQRHLHREPGVLLAKIGHRIGQQQLPWDGGHRHPHMTAHLFTESRHSIEGVQCGGLHIFGTLIKLLARLAQGQPAGGAIEQLHPELLLQAPDTLANHWICQGILFGHLAEGAGLHHLGEENEVVGTGHIYRF